MRKNNLLLFVLLALVVNASAQNIHRNFKGTVTDSATNMPLKDVTIAFYKAQDTSLINFGFSTPNGNYTMELHLKDSILIIVSQMGYNDKIEKIKPAGWEWSFDEINFKLTQASHQLKEVKISAGLIRMKGDTIEINAARLKVLPNSDVSQMFKKIPGFEVAKDGSIKVNGGSVSKIMVDGSEFFGSNPGLVSKNLRADMIEKVQVYDDKDDNGMVTPDNTKTINLKLKKGKRIGFFGDAIAGYGSNDRYEAGLRLNSFHNDRKWSLVINGNNTNDNGFDFGFNNWHGGSWAQRTGSLSRYVYYSNRNDESNSSGNINKKSDLAFTYFNEYSRKRKFSFNIGYNNNNFTTQRNTITENPINDSTKQITSSNQNTVGKAHELSSDINYSKETDSVGRFGIGLNAAYNLYSQEFNSNNIIKTNDALVNTGINNSEKEIAQQTAGFYLNWHRISRKNKKRIFSIIEKSNINSNLISTYQFSDGTVSKFNFKNNNNIYGNEHLLQLSGCLPLIKEFKIASTADVYYMNNTNNIVVLNANNFALQNFSQNYSSKIDSLSLKFYNTAQQFSWKAFLSKGDKDHDLSVGAIYLNLTLGNTDQTNHLEVNKNYNLFLPFITFSNWRRSFGYARFTAEKVVEFPSFTHLMPLQNISNPWMRLVGNPYLVPFEQWHMGGVFSKQNYKRFKNIWSNFDLSQSDNYLCYVNSISANGITYRTPKNLSGYFNENIGLNIKRGLTKKLDFGCWISERYTIVPEIFNEQKNFGNNFAINFNPNISISNSEKLEFDFGVGANYSNYKDQLNPSVNYNQWLPELSTSLRVDLWKGSELNCDLDVEDKRNIPSIGKVVSIFNLYLQQALDKDEKYNLKFTCYDLFKQNVTLSRTVTGSYINTTQSNLLQQFFMLSFIYKMKGKNTEGGGAAY